MNVENQTSTSDILPRSQGESLIGASVLGHWYFLGAIIWLAMAILLGEKCALHGPGSDSSLLALGLLTMLGLWLLQIVDVVWLAVAVRRLGWAIVAGLLQLSPPLGFLGLVLLHATARGQLKAAGIRLTMNGARPEDWQQYLAKFAQKCPNCGEPLLVQQSPCPMCGQVLKM